MNGERWKTVFSFGGDRGLPYPPSPSLPFAPSVPVGSSLPSVASPSNHFTSHLQRIDAKAFPPDPISLPMPVVDFEAGYRNPFAVPELEPASETEQAAPEQTATAEAIPPVIEAPARDLASEVSELVSPVGDYLSEFTVSESPDNFEAGYHDPLSTDRPPQPEQSLEAAGFEARRAGLLAGLQTWADALCQFLEDHREWSVAEFRIQHAEAWKAARDQDAIVNGLAAQGNQSTAEIRKLKATLSNARFVAQSHEAAKPDLDQLPSQADLGKWRAEDARLKATWSTAEQAVASALDRERALARNFERESRKRAALRQREAGLRAKLSGQAVPVMGLEQEPEL